MRFLDELLKRGEVSKMIFNAVVIDGVITMVISIGAPGFIALINAVPIVIPWSQPQGRDTKLLQVRKMIDYAPQITSVIGAWIVPIISGRWRVLRDIICSVAVSKTVGHDQIDHIVGRNTSKMRFGIKRLFNRKRDRRVSPRRFQDQRIRSRPRGRTDIDVYKKINAVSIDESVRGLDGLLRCTNVRTRQILAAHEKPDGINCVAGPPGWRFDFADGRS